MTNLEIGMKVKIIKNFEERNIGKLGTIIEIDRNIIKLKSMEEDIYHHDLVPDNNFLYVTEKQIKLL